MRNVYQLKVNVNTSTFSLGTDVIVLIREEVRVSCHKGL